MATINREALLSKQRLDVAFKMFDKVKKDAENKSIFDSKNLMWIHFLLRMAVELFRLTRSKICLVHMQAYLRRSGEKCSKKLMIMVMDRYENFFFKFNLYYNFTHISHYYKQIQFKEFKEMMLKMVDCE